MNRKFNKKNTTEVDQPLINLTPLIDVVFVVLIAFIIIAPMLDVDKVQLAAKSENSEKTQTIKQETAIVLHVHKDNSIWLNQRRTSLDHLKNQLLILKTQHPNTTPQLFHDKEASFGTYQQIKNIAESLEFKEIDVILKPDSSA